MYGYSGGHACKARAASTNRLARAVRAQIEDAPDGPSCILGDVNADAQDIPELAQLLEYEGWTDLGSVAHMWGREDNEYTCHMPGCTPTRRDFVFVWKDLFLKKFFP